MTKEQLQVKEWMQKFGQETPNEPIIPSLEVRKLRAKLIFEEALETITKGLGIHIKVYDESLSLTSWFCGTELDTKVEFVRGNEPSIKELKDGLADLHYVGYCGTATAYGIDMESVFEEVHRSNMTKLWTPDEVRIFEDDLKVNGYSSTCLQSTPRFDARAFLVKDRYGKVVKSPSYQPPNL